MKRNHKITPEILKVIKASAAQLPLTQKTLNGKPLFRAGKVEKVVYKDIKDKNLKKELLKLDDTLIGSEALNKQELEPIYANHEVNLISCYKAGGFPEMKTYIDTILKPEAFKLGYIADSITGHSFGKRFFQQDLPKIIETEKKIKKIRKYPFLKFFYRALFWVKKWFKK